MNKIWKIKDPDIAAKDALAAELGVSSLFAQILLNRGLTDTDAARRFLRPALEDLHDPFRMKGMERAVARLREACARKERVFIATDFDADGVTSCALLETELKRRGADVRHYVPHRLKDGYGLNEEAVRQAASWPAGVFVSLDCGVTSVAEIAALKQAGLFTIVIDHHEPPDTLPPADAILNPKQRDCPYPFRDLASVGLAFKVAQAMGADDLYDYLDIVAVGTIADVAPLIDENRIFARHGLDRLTGTVRPGLRSLMEAAGVADKKMSARSVSFALAPRLNASGRMDTAHASLDLLLCGDPEEARALASSLNDNNRLRQQTEERVMAEAVEMIEKDVDLDAEPVIVLCKEAWHPGVLGIVASKIADRYYRPAVVISLQEDVGRGSARSVPHFHIYEALSQCAALLKEFGGHQFAAGLTVDRSRVAELRRRLNDVGRACLETADAAAVLEADAEIPLSLAGEDLMRALEQMSPFGEGNPRPLFVTPHLRVRSRPSVVGRNTLKFWVTDGSATLEAVGFGMGGLLDTVTNGGVVDLAYRLGWDTWKAHNPLQLELRDLRVSA
ncbi:MAG: single-stranded-DNA-specific exonuclease RecJ [Deltaproteobacteria bacterium]